MILAFLIGAMLGGAISGLPFNMVGFSTGELIMCILSKVVLVAVFVPIYLLMSVIAKQKSWMSILLSMMVGMLLFMIIPMLTPLNATIMNVLLCMVGGVLIGTGLGAISQLILKKRDIL